MVIVTLSSKAISSHPETKPAIKARQLQNIKKFKKFLIIIPPAF
jgi:hypothetical protein